MHDNLLISKTSIPEANALSTLIMPEFMLSNNNNAGELSFEELYELLADPIEQTDQINSIFLDLLPNKILSKQAMQYSAKPQIAPPLDIKEYSQKLQSTLVNNWDIKLKNLPPNEFNIQDIHFEYNKNKQQLIINLITVEQSKQVIQHQLKTFLDFKDKLKKYKDSKKLNKKVA